MSRKILSIAAGAMLSIGLAGTALAAGPSTLTGPQMDKVTAGFGAHAHAYADAFATGYYYASTTTSTDTYAVSYYGNTAASSSYSRSTAY